MATTPQVLLSQGNCFACLGLEIGQVLILSRLSQILLSLGGPEVTTQLLFDQISCYTCLGIEQGDAMELVLLSLIADAVA